VIALHALPVAIARILEIKVRRDCRGYFAHPLASEGRAIGAAIEHQPLADAVALEQPVGLAVGDEIAAARVGDTS
jgi:hypothetical protein